MGDITLHTTPYGRPAAVALHRRVAAAKADDPLQPVTVVVPTNYVGVSARRMLAGGELGGLTAAGVGVAGLNLLTVYRLAELLGAPRLAAAWRRPVSTPVIAAAVRSVLADEPGIFAEVRDHPSTEEALVRSHRELSELGEQALDALSGAGDRARDVVRIRRAARHRLASRWFEEADLMASARTAVEDGSTVLDDLGTVIVYLPQDLSLPAAALLRAVAARTEVEVIAGRTGVPAADGDVDRVLGLLGTAVEPSDGSTSAGPTATAVVSVSDAEEEVRSAVAAVIAAARDGAPLERIAILYPSVEPYARLVAEQLAAAGIPYSGQGVRPVADRLLGRWLLDLLDLPERQLARPAVMGLLSGAPVRTSTGRSVPVGAWERVSREAGIVRGRADWSDRLRHLATELRARADSEETEDEPRDWLIARLRRSAQDADALRGFSAELFDRLAAAGRLTGWRELVGWCGDVVTRYLGDESARASWPEVERAAAERVENALDRLAGLDEVEPRTSLRTFRRTLQLELDDDLGRVGSFGQGVLVGETSAALGVDLDVVVILGMAEGVFPTRPREDSLLPDVERAIAGPALRLRTAQPTVDHRHLLAALAAGGRERVMIYPRGDLRRSIERAPSRWLLDAVETLGDGGARALPPSAPWLTVVPSFARRVSTVGFPATRQEHALRWLAEAGSPDDLDRHPLILTEDALRRGTELALTRGRDAFTRFDGNLEEHADHLDAPTDGEHPISATRLELWLSCPHAYLMQHILRVEPVENPEELLEIDAMERGSLVHDVLERWLTEQLDAGTIPKPSQPWPAEARRRLTELAELACADAQARGVTGHPLLWRRDRDRIIDDLVRFADEDDERRARMGLTPIGAERPFGLAGEPPAILELGDGRTIAVRGKIDRVDRAEDDSLVVVDYKTGSSRSYDKLRKETPLGDGTKLQLVIYGLAVRTDGAPVRSEYWFTSSKGEFKTRGYRLDDEVIAALQRALRVAVDGISAGRFPMKPPEPGFRVYTECRFCDPDDLDTADRYRDWERVRTAPALADYVAYLTGDEGHTGGQESRS
jgi:ATP-dependent helicase/nuclease subunit B